MWFFVKDVPPPKGCENRAIFYTLDRTITTGYALREIDGYINDDPNVVWIDDEQRFAPELATHWRKLPPPPEDHDMEKD